MKLEDIFIPWKMTFLQSKSKWYYFRPEIIMKLLKQIIGYSLGSVFLAFLGYKFYKAVEHIEAANLIIWLACVIILILIFTIRRVLLD